MTVAELIKQLEKCNPNAEIEIMDLEGNYSTDLEQIENNDDRIYFYAEL